MKENIAKLKEWWSNLAVREKRTVTAGVAMIALFIVYQWIWSPFIDSAALLRKRVESERQLLAWMQNADQTLQKIEKQAQHRKKSLTPVMLLSVLQKLINQAGLDQSLTQLKQSSNDAIALRFQKVEFDKMMNFLILVLKEQSVGIAQFSSTASGTPGIVNAELTLKLD